MGVLLLLLLLLLRGRGLWLWKVLRGVRSPPSTSSSPTTTGKLHVTHSAHVLLIRHAGVDHVVVSSHGGVHAVVTRRWMLLIRHSGVDHVVGSAHGRMHVMTGRWMLLHVLVSPSHLNLPHCMCHRLVRNHPPHAHHPRSRGHHHRMLIRHSNSHGSSYACVSHRSSDPVLHMRGYHVCLHGAHGVR